MEQIDQEKFVSEPPKLKSLLVVAPWLEGGGAQKSLCGLLRALTGTHTTVVTLFAGCRDFNEVADLADEFVMLDYPRSPGGLVGASRAIATHLQHSDVVYSLMRGSHVALGVSSLLKRLPGELIATFHQLPSADETGVFSLVENMLVRKALRHAKLITAPSESAVSQIRQRRYGPHARLVYEPNLIRVDSRETIRRESSGAPLRLLACGRLSKQKGFDRIPELLSDIEIPCEIKILGSGPEEEDLKRRFGSTKSSSHTVELVGRVDDVVPYLDWSDAAFMPSRNELNPVFVWEAWARGRPVVAADLPAFEDLRTSGPVLTFTGAASLRSALGVVSSDEYRDFAYSMGLQASRTMTTRSEIVARIQS
ncbi:glycosyltransferase [Rhodococcus sp. GOMB7]|uniref:glycosyltransferase n=1 Tax=Rhodococcus sp. GOMB7 TaxID=2839033 RepID=UPI0004A9337C|nr:glycosyltransferase [Rhodococcus sp. GOMB7]KDQ01039.1 glycosyl transferase group 1 [Rhodococcus qingshengii]MBT9294639.1 glycosyltransferase [Rhodococcus sp. GOMB7]